MEYVELMNKFLFITHITPVAKRSSLRQDLINIYYKGLLAQTYPHWKVLILGEGESRDKRFHIQDLLDGTRDEKLQRMKEIYASTEVRHLIDEADYVIKLDDDDVISPIVLEQLKDFTGDVFFDDHHCFYNLAGGQITHQKRPWIASTCVHKKEHAFASWMGEGSSADGTLLYSDHSKAWHTYYRDKKVSIASPQHPVYLRILSPTSITAGARKRAVRAIEDVDWQAYGEYLSGFGQWQTPQVHDFDDYIPLLKSAWQSFGGTPSPFIPKRRKRFIFW